MKKTDSHACNTHYSTLALKKMPQLDMECVQSPFLGLDVSDMIESKVEPTTLKLAFLKWLVPALPDQPQFSCHASRRKDLQGRVFWDHDLPTRHFAG